MNTAFSLLSSRVRSPALLALTAITLLVMCSGCAFLKPAQNESHYHVLTAVNPPGNLSHHNQMKPGCVVCLRPVEVASYLETRNMAVRTGTNEITYALFHRWAEPLNAGIRRVLAQDLRAAPEIHAVITDQPAPAKEPLYTVWVQVLACEGAKTNHHNSAVFEAVWEITRSQPEQKTVAHGVFRSRPANWHTGDYSQLASQLSHALDNFSRVLVRAIPQQTDGDTFR